MSRVQPLKGGSHGLAPEEVAEHRRQRLLTAMVESVALYGYPRTTIDRLVGLARISKTDFYRYFDSKESCFWAAFDANLERFAALVEGIVEARRGARGQLEAVIGALAEAIEVEPKGISLVLVDSLSLGPEADDPRRRSQELFERRLRSGVRSEGSRMSELRARGVVIGLRRLVYRALRDESAAELRAGAPALAEWMLDYATSPRQSSAKAKGPRRQPDGIPWDAAPSAAESRMELTPGERILRASVQLTVEKGYSKLTIPAISARAATSNQTLYDDFGSKEGAILTAFDMAIEPALEAMEAAFDFDGSRRERLAAAIAALASHLADDPLLSELAFREMPRVGRPGLERVDVAMDRIAAILLEARPGRISKKAELRAQATTGGLWGVMRQAAAAKGRARTAELVDFALVGLGGTGSGS